MNHVTFLKKLLKRFTETIESARTKHLLDVVIALYTVDSNLVETADAIFEQLMKKIRIESESIDVICNLAFASALWDSCKEENRSQFVECVKARLECESDADLCSIPAESLGRLLFGLGKYDGEKVVNITSRLRIWFDSRFNAYSLLPRDVVRVAYGFAFTGAYNEEIHYVLRKQVYRRAGYFQTMDIKILKEVFRKMDLDFTDQLETDLLSGDKFVYHREYGRF